MTTLKLSKKPTETPAAQKAPVRRADPAKRDRTIAPPKANRPSETQAEPQREQTVPVPSKSVPSKAAQRNHRYDGTPRVAPAVQDVDQANISKPAKQKGIDTRTTPKPSREEPQYRQAPRRGGKVRDGYDTSASAYSPAAKAAYKSAPVNDDLPRLSKVMAERGICSRREADDWIANGWVKVDGVIVDTLGTRIRPDADIIVSDYAREEQAENVTIILNKPIGYVSGQAEDGYEPAVVLVHPDNQWQEDSTPIKFARQHLKNLAPAGRLDIDSTGMLVLTQDGRIARHLIGEDSSVEKEYLVRVEGELSEANLKRLNHGLSLDGVVLKPAKVSWQNEDQLRFVLREGRKRQIRRMCELVGLHVVGLKRIRIGSVTLGQLPMGQWRYLRSNERF